MSKPSFTELLAARKAAQSSGEASAAAVVEEKKEEAKPAVVPSFLQRLQTAAAKVEPKVEEASFSPIKPVEPMPNVISAANLAASKLPTQESVAVTGEDSVVVEQIRQRIADLQNMEHGQIKDAMKTLQGMLIANPSACSLMLPEDAGLLVRALRKMTGNTQAIMLANSKPSKKGKATSTSALEKLSVTELAKLSADQDWD